MTEERFYDIVELMAIDALKRAVNKWGIEGTEQKIHELCSQPSMRIVKEYHLRLFNRIYKGKSDDQT